MRGQQQRDEPRQYEPISYAAHRFSEASTPQQQVIKITMNLKIDFQMI
jgi:hypothetical protein